MKIKFLPSNIEADINPDKSVLELAREHGLRIQSACNGMRSCGDCRVFLKEGESHVLPPTGEELKLIGQGHYIDQRRLSCQLYCFGGAVVDLSEQEERFRQGRISKQFLERTQKKSAGETRSKGGILIEDDEDFKAAGGRG